MLFRGWVAIFIFAPAIKLLFMTISYNWLHEYLPEIIPADRLSRILTSIGLEVESMESFESLKGGLNGLFIGEVLTCEKHPDADKLHVTTVNIGSGEPLQIVCGAPNVAAGQKVVVATVGATIYPVSGDPLTMKKAKIRGVESYGMICAEDEIGMGESHAGILVLPKDVIPGTPAAQYFQIYTDTIYEIGLTPNRMDAMSHLGVARDVCAYLSHHDKKHAVVKNPLRSSFSIDESDNSFTVEIKDAGACSRYSGVLIKNINVSESPDWLKNRLRSIGLRPINNIVDITNFILHETGQPLHAFDASAITGKKVTIQCLPENTVFTTLDEKERKLSAADLMICNAEAPMCIAGVYGGLNSGVTASTTDIFLESAWFHPTSIRKTSMRHGLRTDAATRFEKGVDISQVTDVLKRAALMIRELGGGRIASDIIDVYPQPKPKTEVLIKYHYIKKLSGKHYHAEAIHQILTSLGFEIMREGVDDLLLSVPYSKPDISLPADIVEEIMRIDGLDNIEIPQQISIAPAVENNYQPAVMKEKFTGWLTGLGFSEIFTNSITDSGYYPEEQQASIVKMLNSLSAGLNCMRPSMIETGLETLAYNINRKNNHLALFEFGKTYSTNGTGKYHETQHLMLFGTGLKRTGGWQQKEEKMDYYYVRGLAARLIQLAGLSGVRQQFDSVEGLDQACTFTSRNEVIAVAGALSASKLKQFDIKQPVFVVDVNWDRLLQQTSKQKIEFAEIPKFPAVQRDLAIVIDRSVSFEAIEKATKDAGVKKLTSLQLFDIFESDKLGANKKSVALSFSFLDPEKTFTDQEVDSMMNKLMQGYEKALQAEIRK